MLGSFWRRPAGEGDVESATEDSSSDAPEPQQTEDEEEDKAETETWVEWIRRCTHTVEQHLQRASIDGWVVAQRRRKWRLAGHTPRREDNRWSEAVLGWEPPVSNRLRGRPCRRWTDDLDAYFHHVLETPRWIWKAAAQDREEWQRREDEFIASRWV